MSSVVSSVSSYFLNKDVTNFAISNIFSNTFYPIIFTSVNDILLPFLTIFLYNFSTSSLNVNILGQTVMFGKVLSNITVFLLSMLILYFGFILPFDNQIKKNAMKKERKDKLRDIRMEKYLNDIKNIVKSIHSLKKINL